MEETTQEIVLLLADIRVDRQIPSVRNRAAAASLTQSFYNGIKQNCRASIAVAVLAVSAMAFVEGHIHTEI